MSNHEENMTGKKGSNSVQSSNRQIKQDLSQTASTLTEEGGHNLCGDGLVLSRRCEHCLNGAPCPAAV